MELIDYNKVCFKQFNTQKHILASKAVIELKMIKVWNLYSAWMGWGCKVVAKHCACANRRSENTRWSIHSFIQKKNSLDPLETASDLKLFKWRYKIYIYAFFDDLLQWKYKSSFKDGRIYQNLLKGPNTGYMLLKEGGNFSRKTDSIL